MWSICYSSELFGLKHFTDKLFLAYEINGEDYPIITNLINIYCHFLSWLNDRADSRLLPVSWEIPFLSFSCLLPLLPILPLFKLLSLFNSEPLPIFNQPCLTSPASHLLFALASTSVCLVVTIVRIWMMVSSMLGVTESCNSHWHDPYPWWPQK